MAESQAHGNTIEDIVIQAKFSITKAEYDSRKPGGYTNSFDIVSGIPESSEHNESIKSTKSSTVYLADILRFYNSVTNHSFKLVVARYRQEGDTKIIHAFHEFVIDHEFSDRSLEIFYGNMPLFELEKFVTYVKNIPHGKNGQRDNATLWKLRRDDLYTLGRGIVNIDAKIDSNSQRRVQCSVELLDLIENFPHTTYRENYHSIKLPYTISSLVRERNDRDPDFGIADTGLFHVEG